MCGRSVALNGTDTDAVAADEDDAAAHTHTKGKPVLKFNILFIDTAARALQACDADADAAAARCFSGALRAEARPPSL